MSVSQSDKLQQALLQAEHGHRVFLARPGGKQPLSRGWQKSATVDAEMIEKVLAQNSNCNIAVATGRSSDLLAVDIDVRNGNGFQALQQLDPSGLGWESLETPKVRTPSGGGHAYFLMPQRLRLTTGSDAAHGIDFRADGGLLICPGSEIAEGEYAWEHSLDEIPKADCPGWLLEFLQQPKTKPQQQAAVGGLLLQVEADLATHPGAGQGERNSVLCRLVGSAIAGGQPPDQILQLAKAWNKRCNPPASQAEIEQTVLAIVGAELQKQRQSPAVKQSEHVASPLVLVTRTAAAIKPKAVEWLWKNHFQIGAINLIGGPEGRGKSLVAVHTAARTSTGTEWPDGSPCQRGRVLYCAAEEVAETILVPRLMAAGADLSRIEIVDGLGTRDASGKVTADIDLKRCLPAVHEKLSEPGERYLLCVWDTFQSCSLTTDHKCNVGQKAVVQPLQAMAEELGVAMVCVEHHNRGGLGRGNPDAAILGGGLTRTARVIWHVIDDPEDKQKQRLLLPGKMNNAPRDVDLGWRFTFGEVERCIDGRQVMLPVIDWLEPAGVTIHEVQEMEGAGSNASSNSESTDEFHRACEWLLGFLTEPRPHEEIKAGWTAELLKERTIRRAKAHLMIGSEQRDRKWYWMPPPAVSIGDELVAGPAMMEP